MTSFDSAGGRRLSAAQQALRLEAIASITDGLAHNLNNALAPVLASAQMLDGKVPDGQPRKCLDLLTGSAWDCADLVKQLIVFAGGMSGERVDVDLRCVMDEACRAIRPQLGSGVALEIENRPRRLWPVAGDAEQLAQAVGNLLLNANEALPAGGRIGVSMRHAVVDREMARVHSGAQPGQHVIVIISDTGAGIAREGLHRIFDPFFSTKECRGNRGLGLSFALGIVRSHGGFIRARNLRGSGAEFRLYLPAASRQAKLSVPCLRPLPTRL